MPKLDLNILSDRINCAFADPDSTIELAVSSAVKGKLGERIAALLSMASSRWVPVYQYDTIDKVASSANEAALAKLMFVGLCDSSGEAFKVNRRNLSPIGKSLHDEYMLLWKEAQQRPPLKHSLLQPIRKEVGLFLKEVGLRSISDLGDFETLANAFGYEDSVNSFSDLMFTSMQIKRAAAGKLILTFFSFVQRIGDVREELSDVEINIGYAAARVWQAEGFISGLLLLRRAGKAPEYEPGAVAVISENLTKLSRVQQSIFQAHLDENFSDRITRNPGALNGLSAATYYSFAIASAANMNDVNNLGRLVDQVYSNDQFNLAFINWELVSSCFSRSKNFADPLWACVLAHFLNDRLVRQVAQHVSWRHGIGTFDSRMGLLIDSVRRQHLSKRYEALLIRISRLTEQTRYEICERLLCRSGYEQFGPMIPPERSNLGDEGRDLTHSIYRIEAVKVAREKDLLEERLAADYLKDEQENFCYIYFNDLYVAGRVLMDWDGIKEDLIREVETSFPYIVPSNRGSKPSDVLGSMYDRVVILAAEQLAQLAIEKSAHSINGELSNNLRHGVIVPRVLRAIEDAVGLIAPVANSAPIREKLTVCLGADAAELVSAFSVDVKALLETFMAEHLVADTGGEFGKKVVGHIEECIRAVGEAPNSRSPRGLAHSIVNGLKREFRIYLKSKERLFSKQFWRELEALLDALVFPVRTSWTF